MSENSDSFKRFLILYNLRGGVRTPDIETTDKFIREKFDSAVKLFDGVWWYSTEDTNKNVGSIRADFEPLTKYPVSSPAVIEFDDLLWIVEIKDQVGEFK